MAYKVSSPFNVSATVLKSETKKVNGINTKVYTEVGNIFCSFRAFGGTERESNDLLIVENTAVVETYYTPTITNDCKLKLENGTMWDIHFIENIDMKNQYLTLKVRSIKGNV